MDDFETKKKIFMEKLRLLKDNSDLMYRLLKNETVTFDDASKTNPDVSLMLALNLLDIGHGGTLYLPPHVRIYQEDLLKTASQQAKLHTEDFQHIRMLLREEMETDPANSGYIDGVIQRLDEFENSMKTH